MKWVEDGLTEIEIVATLDVFETTGTCRSPLFPLASRLTKQRWAFYKRVMDIVLSLILLTALLVPFVMIAILIKLDSRGPVLFRQLRRGRHNVFFSCFKFRTMRHDCADNAAKEQSQRNDPRVTRLGGFLRRKSLDELPQLFNVLLGQMSLVGPRPHALGTAINGRLLMECADDYLLRYGVKPGITGWAQVNGFRGILDHEEKLQKRIAHDLYYIIHWTPILDLRILFRTLKCVCDPHAF